MNDLFDLSGKRALITGASRGIGRALALGFAKAGADVAVHYASNHKAGDIVVKEIQTLGRKAIGIGKNLKDADCADVIWNAVRTVLVLWIFWYLTPPSRFSIHGSK